MQPRNKSSGIGKQSHKGNMTIVLSERAGTRNIPKDAANIELIGNTLKITDGLYWPTIPGFMFRASERNFGWGFNYIKYILDDDGNVIWANERYEQEARKIQENKKITQ